MGLSKRHKHAHNACVFFMGIAAIALGVAALNVDWYSVEDDYTLWVGTANTTVTYSFQNITIKSVGTAGNSQAVSYDRKAWSDEKSTYPNTFKVYQTSQSLTIIGVIAAGAVCFATFMHALCHSCSKTCRRMFKWLAFFATMVALGSAIVAWASFFKHPTAYAADAKQNSPTHADCNTGPCLNIRGTTTNSILGASHIQTWTPILGFWIELAASFAALVAFCLAARRIFG